MREEFNGGPQTYKIPVSKTDNADVEVDKYYLRSLIERLWHDVLSRPGKFLFNATPEVVEVFLYLHNTVENIVKSQLETHVDKEIGKNCLKVLNEDIQLREMWFKVLGNEDNFKFKSGCVLVKYYFKLLECL